LVRHEAPLSSGDASDCLVTHGDMDVTCCATNSSLGRHAALVTALCEARPTKSPTSGGTSWPARAGVASASRKAEKGRGLFRMGNVCELPTEPGSVPSGQTCCQAIAKRHAAKMRLSKLSARRCSAVPGEAGPKRIDIGAFGVGAGNLRNVVSPTIRLAPSVSRQGSRKTTCWMRGYESVEKANARL